MGIKFPEGCGVEVEEGCFLLSIFLETNLLCVCVQLLWRGLLAFAEERENPYHHGVKWHEEI